ncbi:MAG: DUF3021 domain-containing protein [Eubacterium sp.]|nr:DUF3021 domain-containing protein [Eubacterium sp.]
MKDTTKDFLKQTLKRGAVSFSISAIIGLLINLVIDLCVNAAGNEGFMSMSPEARALFPTPAIAAYVNVLLYGAIGATFAMMTFLFEIDRLGFVIQSILYFVLTSLVLVGITILLWQLHRHPKALIPTLAGYAVTYFIMFTVEYKELKKNIREINRELDESA